MEERRREEWRQEMFRNCKMERGKQKDREKKGRTGNEIEKVRARK